MSSIVFDFNKYAGKEVSILESKKTWTSRRDSTAHEYAHYEFDDTDEVLAEMFDEIAQSGANVRVWLPNTMGTMDYQPGRMNIHISKGDDGKWRIEPTCDMG